MAKHLADILAFPTKQAEVVPFPIVQCGCHRSNCGKIDINQHEYIYSRATKEYYSDLECLIHAVEDVHKVDSWSKRLLYGDEWISIEDFLKEMQAESNINYLPIA